MLFIYSSLKGFTITRYSREVSDSVKNDLLVKKSKSDTKMGRVNFLFFDFEAS